MKYAETDYSKPKDYTHLLQTKQYMQLLLIEWPFYGQDIE